MALFFYGSVIAAMILYANTTFIFKKLKEGLSAEFNIAIGSILTGFILYSILYICAR
ncbi:MAG: hypothetical protein MJB12_17910 [Firmicutes bacterium]|nr:hypothetical protein [Bacillota bacterium]